MYILQRLTQYYLFTNSPLKAVSLIALQSLQQLSVFVISDGDTEGCKLLEGTRVLFGRLAEANFQCLAPAHEFDWRVEKFKKVQSFPISMLILARGRSVSSFLFHSLKIENFLMLKTSQIHWFKESLKMEHLCFRLTIGIFVKVMILIQKKQNPLLAR